MAFGRVRALIKYCLDTDHWIYWLNGDQAIDDKIDALGDEQIYIAPPSVAELYYGAYHSARVKENLFMLNEIFDNFIVLELGPGDLVRFGRIKADLARRGRPVGDFDLLIACMALERDLIVVTHNRAHFKPIEGLQVEDWRS
jgi:tRNA(fMet)-specific endonuclease VapC